MNGGVRRRMDDCFGRTRAGVARPAYAASKLCDVLLAFAVARRLDKRETQSTELDRVAEKDGRRFAPDDRHQERNPGLACGEREELGNRASDLFLSSTHFVREPRIVGRYQRLRRVAWPSAPHLRISGLPRAARWQHR